jgi:hypothetical protein
VKRWKDRLAELTDLEAFPELTEIARYRDSLGEILKALADMEMLKAGDAFKPIVDQLEKLIAP